MAIPFRPPEPTEEQWADHQREVAKCRGATCFAALAAHFKTKSPVVLEKRVDGRSPYITQGGERSSSGKYRRWFRDGIAPSDDTIERVLGLTDNAFDLGYWRDLILWQLLARDPPALDKLHYLMEESFPRSIRKILFDEYDRDRFGRFIHFDIGREQILDLRDVRSLPAFLAMLCLAREGELLGDDPRHSLPTMCAFDMLPYVLHRCAPLRFRWENLFACLERVFFRRIYGDSGAYYDFPRQRVASGLVTLDSDPNAPLRQMSGHHEPRAEKPADPPSEAEQELRKLLSSLGRAGRVRSKG